MNIRSSIECKLLCVRVIAGGLTALVLGDCADEKGSGKSDDVDDADSVFDVSFEVSSGTSADSGGGDFVVVPGGLGAPCVDNRDCDSGYCIQGADGFICTVPCVAECPDGFGCKGIESGS